MSGKAWRIDVDLDSLHGEVTPLNDLIHHHPGPECACGPSDLPVPQPDGAVRWLLVHHSLDGRERTEPTPPRRHP